MTAAASGGGASAGGACAGGGEGGGEVSSTGGSPPRSSGVNGCGPVGLTGCNPVGEVPSPLSRSLGGGGGGVVFRGVGFRAGGGDGAATLGGRNGVAVGRAGWGILGVVPVCFAAPSVSSFLGGIKV